MEVLTIGMPREHVPIPCVFDFYSFKLDGIFY